MLDWKRWRQVGRGALWGKKEFVDLLLGWRGKTYFAPFLLFPFELSGGKKKKRPEEGRKSQGCRDLKITCDNNLTAAQDSVGRGSNQWGHPSSVIRKAFWSKPRQQGISGRHNLPLFNQRVHGCHLFYSGNLHWEQLPCRIRCVFLYKGHPVDYFHSTADIL